MSNSESNESRRSFIKKAAYIAPVVLTLKALPSFAAQGSNNGVGQRVLDNQPPGDPPINDGPGTSPGSPGNNPNN
jgi:hypothetical protein